MKQTLQTLLTYGREQLKRKGSPEPEMDAKYLLLEAFCTDMVHFLMNRSQELPQNSRVEEMTARYREMIAQRGRRIPLQQILGTQEFMGFSFYVNRHVLIPRQDTETLVELVLREHPGNGEAVLDLCTGSGCIALSLALKGSYGKICAVDLSREALKVAEKNKHKLLDEDMQAKVEFLEGDLFAALEKREGLEDEKVGEKREGLRDEEVLEKRKGPKEKFDLLVSNPPYIPTNVIAGLEPEVRDYEPRMALDGSEDGLAFYRRIAAESGPYINDEAFLYLEIGWDQGEAVKKILQEAGFSQVRIVQDACKNDRVVCAVKRAQNGGNYV